MTGIELKLRITRADLSAENNGRRTIELTTDDHTGHDVTALWDDAGKTAKAKGDNIFWRDATNVVAGQEIEEVHLNLPEKEALDFWALINAKRLFISDGKYASVGNTGLINEWNINLRDLKLSQPDNSANKLLNPAKKDENGNYDHGNHRLILNEKCFNSGTPTVLIDEVTFTLGTYPSTSAYKHDKGEANLKILITLIEDLVKKYGIYSWVKIVGKKEATDGTDAFLTKIKEFKYNHAGGTNIDANNLKWALYDITGVYYEGNAITPLKGANNSVFNLDKWYSYLTELKDWAAKGFTKKSYILKARTAGTAGGTAWDDSLAYNNGFTRTNINSTTAGEIVSNAGVYKGFSLLHDDSKQKIDTSTDPWTVEDQPEFQKDSIDYFRHANAFPADASTGNYLKTTPEQCRGFKPGDFDNAGSLIATLAGITDIHNDTGKFETTKLNQYDPNTGQRKTGTGTTDEIEYKSDQAVRTCFRILHEGTQAGGGHLDNIIGMAFLENFFKEVSDGEKTLLDRFYQVARSRQITSLFFTTGPTSVNKILGADATAGVRTYDDAKVAEKQANPNVGDKELIKQLNRFEWTYDETKKFLNFYTKTSTPTQPELDAWNDQYATYELASENTGDEEAEIREDVRAKLYKFWQKDEKRNKLGQKRIRLRGTLNPKQDDSKPATTAEIDKAQTDSGFTGDHIKAVFQKAKEESITKGGLKKLSALLIILENAWKTPVEGKLTDLEFYYKTGADAYSAKAWEIVNKVERDGKKYGEEAKKRLEEKKEDRKIETARSECKILMNNDEAYNAIEIEKINSIEEVDTIKAIWEKATKAWEKTSFGDNTDQTLLSDLETKKTSHAEAWKKVDKYQKNKDKVAETSGYATGALNKLKGLKEKNKKDWSDFKKLGYDERKTKMEEFAKTKTGTEKENFEKIDIPRMLAAAELDASSRNNEEKELKRLLEINYLSDYSETSDDLEKIKADLEKLKSFKESKGKTDDKGKALAKITKTTDFYTALDKFITKIEERKSAIAEKVKEKDKKDTKGDGVSVWWWIAGGAGIVALIGAIIYFTRGSDDSAEE